MNGPISSRAQGQLDRLGLFAYYTEHHLRKRDGFHRTDNPDGYIGLCVAENLLVSEFLLAKMSTCRDTPPRSLAYDDYVGSVEFRTATARFMGRTILKRSVNPDHLYAMAGASAVLETFFFAIADPGDSVLIPTPSYAGFWGDIEGRDEVNIVPVHTSSENGFHFTTASLDAALESAPTPVRALIFTSPDNPLGRVYSPAQIEEIVAWAERRDIHLIVDEVYALSVFGESPFTSVAALRPTLGDKIHLVWAYSKDFAVSGFRAGVVYTENEDIGQSLKVQAMWSAMSGDTQHLLASMVSDDEWVDGYITYMQATLAEAYRRTTEALRGIGIPYQESEAGFFLLCDFRGFLCEPTWAAEHELWKRFLEEGGVNVTPGSACRIVEPGFMRLCFAAEPTDTVVTGIAKIGQILGRSLQ